MLVIREGRMCQLPSILGILRGNVMSRLAFDSILDIMVLFNDILLCLPVPADLGLASSCEYTHVLS